MFVEAVHFTDPVRPSRLIVNNTVIIKKTSSINNIQRETRNLGGAGSQKVFVNEGPGLAMIEKATHHSLKTVPVREAALRTHIPTSVSRRNADAASHEQPQHPWFERRNPAPAKAAEAPARESIYDGPGRVFGPPRPVGHEAAPAREREAERGDDHGSRHDKEQGHDHGGGKQ
jgi:hypothetical protein